MREGPVDGPAVGPSVVAVSELPDGPQPGRLPIPPPVDPLDEPVRRAEQVGAEVGRSRGRRIAWTRGPRKTTRSLPWCSVMCDSGRNCQSGPDIVRSPTLRRVTSSGRMPVSRWTSTIARIVGHRKGRVASTTLSGTGLTGSGASHRPWRSAATARRSWYSAAGHQLFLGRPAEKLSDRVRPAVTLAPGNPLADELCPARLQGQRAEVLRERIAVEPAEHTDREIDQRDLIGHPAVLDVVLFTVADVGRH